MTHVDEPETVNRRDMIKKTAAGAAIAGVVWSAPKIEGLSLRPNYAAAGSGGPFNASVSVMGTGTFSAAFNGGAGNIQISANTGGASSPIIAAITPTLNGGGDVAWNAADGGAASLVCRNGGADQGINYSLPKAVPGFVGCSAVRLLQNPGGTTVFKFTCT
ncbi:MAG: hypothetical protein AAF567_01100 [Actinomycetota bacterium]